MENAIDALYMAASILLLVIALAVGISSFSNLRISADRILNFGDRVDKATVEENGNKVYINYIANTDSSDVRTVKADTVMTTVRRVFKESYTIYIKTKNMPTYGTNLANTVISTEKDQKYNNNLLISKNEQIIKISIDGENYKNLVETGSYHKVSDSFMDQLYDLIKNSYFKEYLGIYQIETEGDVSSANKNTYRTITFIEQ